MDFNDQAEGFEFKDEEEEQIQGLSEIDPCFMYAGEEESLEIWTVKDLELEEWPVEQYGKFYQGKCYLILATANLDSGALGWDVHYWQGADSSIDSRFVAALKVTELNQHLQKKSVTHREEPGNESELFVSYFPDETFEILTGGHDTALNHPEKENHVKRLFQIKGKHMNRIRTQLVPLSVSSLNSGDAFLLEAYNTIYTWVGKDANITERAKVLELSAQWLACVKGGPEGSMSLCPSRRKCRVVSLFEGWECFDEWRELGEFWEELEAEEKSSKSLSPRSSRIKSAREGGDDATFEADAVLDLYRIADAGKADPDISFVDRNKSGNLSKKILQSNKAYLLDCDSELFVWFGRLASEKARNTAAQMAHDSVSQFERPMKNIPLIEMHEGHELPQFTAKFEDWFNNVLVLPHFSPVRLGKAARRRDTTFDCGPSARSMMKQRALVKESPKEPCPVWEDSVGSGHIRVYRVDQLDLIPIHEDDIGVFDNRFSYIIMYMYVHAGRDRQLIYFWEGNQCMPGEYVRWKMDLLPDLLDSFAGECGVPPVTRRVKMLRETAFFHSLFRDKQIIIMNPSLNTMVKSKTFDSVLFQVNSLFYPGQDQENIIPERTLTLQVKCCANSLSPLNVFVCASVSTGTLFVWYGSHCHPTEKEVSKRLVKRLRHMAEKGTYQNVVVCEEGSETKEFWEVLGVNSSGSFKHPRVVITQQAADSRFDISGAVCIFRPSNTGGNINIERIFEWTVDDFGPRNVLFIEAYGRLHLWRGRLVPDQKYMKAKFVARRYQKINKMISIVVDECDGQESPFLCGVIPDLVRRVPLHDPYHDKEKKLIEMGVQGREMADSEYEPLPKDPSRWVNGQFCHWLRPN